MSHIHCPICTEKGGFHSGACYEYTTVPDELRGPGNSKEFMAWLKNKDTQNRQREDKLIAEAKAHFASQHGS